ncbi:MAG TPA: hypothetical protein VHZ06_00245 [Marmoricola sp.]|nr:hypothetical protein [Marmoricola sp.]
MVRSRSARRRQRSVRVTVAVSLLAVATVAVLATLPTQSPTWLSAGSVSALVLGWAALRIVWTEVLQSRREQATDRAATASAYRSLFSERAAEHAEFTTAMTERLATSTVTMHELQGELVASQRRVAEIGRRAENAESSYAATLVRVAELERSIDLLRDEQEVEELVAFDELVAQAAGKHASAESIEAKLA